MATTKRAASSAMEAATRLLESPEPQETPDAGSVESSNGQMDAAAASSIIDEVRQLQQTLESKKSSAIQALLAQRNEIDSVLHSLGWADDEPIKRVRRMSKAMSDRFCKICQISGHDARAHKGQTKKRKFNDSELAQLSA